ncbi:MAG TPA: LysR substrate-binding domain-containing protein [Ramlibacter sp.]|nr:LysR substrate-binding domain-containing protein [Ramlibacter sp.]
MDRAHLPLTALRAFEATARHLSVTRAAQELFVTQAAVSQQLAGLEARLGVALTRRQGRRLELTAPGLSLFVTLKQCFDQMQAGVSSVERRPGRAKLALMLYPTLAARWLIPRLAGFHEKHPDVDVQITTSLQRVDFARDGADLSILYASEMDAGVAGDPLMSEVLLPVCSPRLLPARRKPTLAQLRQWTWLYSGNRLDDWQIWLQAAGSAGLEPRTRLQFGSSYLAYEAAVDGLGVAMAQEALVAQDLRLGRLVAPFALRVPTQRTYFLTYPAARRDEPLIRSFRDWVLGTRDAPPPTQ